MQDRVVSITLYGKLESESKYSWIEWYEYCKKNVLNLGYVPNYISIESDSIKTNKILNLSKKEKKVLLSINNNEYIKWLSIYSLPENFTSASFDYNVLITRNKKYLSIIMNKEVYLNLNLEETLSELKNFIELNYGEIYEMNRSESPLLYASGLNEVSEFETLKILKKFI